MTVGASIEAAIAQWLADLTEQQRSPDTVATYRSAMHQFQVWLAERPEVMELGTLRISLLVAYIQAALGRKLHRHTILAYIGVLTRWLQDLVNQGELDTGIPNQRGRLIPPTGVRDLLERMVGRRTPPVAPRIPDLRDLPNYYPHALDAWLMARGGVLPTPAESRPFRDYLSLLRNQALVGTLFSTGGRINEVLGLNVRQVRQGGMIVSAVPITGKGRKTRPLRLDEDARAWLAQYLDARQPLFGTAPALFISHGPRGAGNRMTDVTGWRVVKLAADALADAEVAAGATEASVQSLRAVSPHAIRHYVAQAMLDEGADYKDIAAILGHSSSLVTETVYARLDEERMLEVADTFAPRRRRTTTRE